MNVYKKLLDIINEFQGTELEMDKEFKSPGYSTIDDENTTYRMTEDGLKDNRNADNDVLFYDLFKQKCEIIEIDWAPKDNGSCFVPDPLSLDLYYEEVYFEDTPSGQAWLERKLLCKTKEEAIKKSKKMLNEFF